ncbi:MAG: ABC transporter ATP-binding protein [Candidatus Nomurabacteria bacterium]|jgi:putative ABC transport system ATP-binding protein|nr:ABC transporter ATP-binding protein [Candidatus Nomurabacteria bacterium]
MTKNILKISGLQHEYDSGQTAVKVLKGVDVSFESGKMYAIVGESGSGKTTLISLIAALDKIQDGDITFNGQSIAEIGETEFRLKFVNIVFQSFNLIRYMTARENVEVALDFAGEAGDRKAQAYELLAKVGIKRSEADRLVLKLSGGQQQRVAIARAMAGDVPIVVADEPTGNLDEKTEEKILALFKDLADSGKIVIIVTHSQKVARHAHAIVYSMKSGKLN